MREHRAFVAFFPEFKQIVIQRHRPPDAALQECDVEFWEFLREAAHEQRPAGRVAASREKAQPIVDVIGRGLMSPNEIHTMASRHDFQLHTFGPKGVVVVGAVERNRRIGAGVGCEVRRLQQDLRMRPYDFVASHQRAHAEFVDGELDFGNGLLRRVHGNQGGRRHLVRDVLVHVGVHHVQRTADTLPQLVVRQRLGAESRCAIEGREIDAGLFQTPGTELRQHHRGAVERQRARREAPGYALGLIGVTAG